MFIKIGMNMFDLKKALNDCGYTVPQAATEFGISKQALYNYTKGRIIPPGLAEKIIALVGDGLDYNGIYGSIGEFHGNKI